MQKLQYSHQNISCGNDWQVQVLRSPLLQFCIRGAEVRVRLEDILYLRLDLREEVNELDIGGEEQCTCSRGAEMVLPREMVVLVHQISQKIWSQPINMCKLFPTLDSFYKASYLWMQKLELYCWCWSGVPCNQVAKLTQDVTTNLHHILVTSWGL